MMMMMMIKIISVTNNDWLFLDGNKFKLLRWFEQQQQHAKVQLDTQPHKQTIIIRVAHMAWQARACPITLVYKR